MSLSKAAAAAGTLAVGAYLNAKYHIGQDLNALTRPGNPFAAQAFVDKQFARDRLLTFQVLEDQALRNRPNQIFLIFEDRQWTYAQFFNAVTRVGNWMVQELGIQRGDIVALYGGNSPEYMMMWQALEGIGALPSFINNKLTGKSLLHCIKICNCKYVLCDLESKDNVKPSEEDLKQLGIKTVYYDPILVESCKDAVSLPEDRSKGWKPEDMRSLIYTSGTTGLPKAMRILTGREIFVGYMTARYLRLKPTDRYYTCMPLYHGAAHALCVTPCIHAGSTLVLSRKFSHSKFWPEIRSSEATYMQYVGELCRYLLNAPPSPLDKSHKVRMVFGNGMRPDVWETFRDRFGIPIINELYAATDGMGSMFNENHGDFSRNAIGVRGLIWYALLGRKEVRVKMDVDTEQIVRDENGFAITCRDGEPGEVVHKIDPRAPIPQFAGYYDNEEAGEKRMIKNLFKAGDIWFRSGDMQRVDADGRVYFVDRLGDTFRWKSENVSTNEVSDVLCSHPHIDEANVYGVAVPNSDGRCGCAAIVLAQGITETNLDLEGLAQHVLGSLPRYAVPIFIRLTPALDYTGTLKMQKGKLKKEGIDVDIINGNGDRIYWLPNDGRSYVLFGKKDYDELKSGIVYL